MKTRLLLTLLSILSLSNGCSPTDQEHLEGTYTGTFERNGVISNVEIRLENGLWSGISDLGYFPALCNGSYSIRGNSINFENHCAWTANFDHSLILAEDWTFNLNGNTLVLSRSTDEYVLKK